MDILRNLLDSILSCFNCGETSTIEPTERTSLLQHNVDHRSLQVRRISDRIEAEEYANTPTALCTKDEQSELTKIVQETNSNIIDVAALDTHHMLEVSEYTERIKIYNHRLAQQWSNIPVQEPNYDGLLKDVANPEQLLTTNPPLDDITTAKEFIKEVAQAINEIKIDNHEELVVPFQVT